MEKVQQAASTLATLGIQACSPTDRMVWLYSHFAGFIAWKRKSASDFVRHKEPLEHFIRQQPSARRQTDKLFPLLHESTFDKLGNRGASVPNRRLAKLRSELPQADAPRQPQPKKKTLLQGGLGRNRGPLEARLLQVLFQGIHGRKSYRLDVGSGRSQHRMRV